MLSQSEINQFNKDGAVLIKGKFDKEWIEKLRNGIDEDINNPSPRFERHTKDKDALVTSKIFGPGIFIKTLKTLFLIHLLLKLPQSF